MGADKTMSLTASFLLTDPIQIRQDAAPDWKASSKKRCVLPRSSLFPPTCEYNCSTEPGSTQWMVRHGYYWNKTA